jgi:hypothetical protein
VLSSGLGDWDSDYRIMVAVLAESMNGRTIGSPKMIQGGTSKVRIHLKSNIVTHPRDWPWRSFSFYAKKESGPVRIDPIH